MSFLEACRQRMHREKMIAYLRSDSAFYQAGVLNWCEYHGTLFTITADQDRAVREAIKTIVDWHPFRGDREIGETVHTMDDTPRPFRLVVLHWRKGQLELSDPEPYEYEVLATNWEEAPQEIVDLHNQRRASNFPRVKIRPNPPSQVLSKAKQVPILGVKAPSPPLKSSFKSEICKGLSTSQLNPKNSD